jgi:FAD-linked sulfhydryl oxidase
MARRQHLTLTVVLVVIAFLSISYFLSSGKTVLEPSHTKTKPPVDESNSNLNHLPGSILVGGSIAPKLENATAK